MKKILFIFIAIIFSMFQSVSAEPDLRDYNGIELPEGTFIQVISMQEFSTLATDYKTPLEFIATNDTYMFDSNIIPKGTKFIGKIEKKNEPIIGTNASMVVRITKLRFADGYENPIYAYIYTPSGCMIGGELTAPDKYRTIPHYHKGICRHYLGVLQWVPGETRKMGEHTTVASGAQLLIMLKGPAFITHTLN
ncbi:MAG: hypothetical protein ACI4S3_06940 [Candidatus Gastranaerophilaceae bacterium]